MKRITANQFQTSERYYKLPKVLFEDYAKKYGHENFTMRNWADFQYYKDKTLDLVIAVTTAKFTLFNIQSVIDLTQKDSMDLKTWGTQKTMVYLVIPDNDTTFRFLSALFFSMVFSTLTRQADVDFKGQLPIHVRSYLDEFANVGEIPDFAEQTSTVSSWNMSLVPILQNIAQLFLIYWEGNSGDKLLERQTRASEWYYQIEKGFSQPNGGTAQSNLKALEAVRGDLFENSIPGGGDGMGYAYGQCTWGVAARINQLGLKLKGKTVRRFQLSVPWAMAKIGYEQPQVSVGRQGQVHKQELLFPLREEDMAHQQNTDMWLSSKNSTQMAHSLSPKPITMAIQTIPSVNYLEWIVT